MADHTPGAVGVRTCLPGSRSLSICSKRPKLFACIPAALALLRCADSTFRRTADCSERGLARVRGDAVARMRDLLTNPRRGAAAENQIGSLSPQYSLVQIPQLYLALVSATALIAPNRLRCLVAGGIGRSL